MELAVPDRLPFVSVEDSIVKFVVELSLHFILFDDVTQIRLQGSNLVGELTISSNMNKEPLRIGCCQGRDACFVFPPGRHHEV